MNEGNSIRLTVLGTRGSIPVSGGDTREFGGATSCYLVEAAGHRLLLDAGTGIVNAPAADGPDVILLSHAHLDHIQGLPFFPPLSQKGREIHIFAAARGGLTCEEQLGRLFSLPLWPCGLDGYPADVRCRALPERLSAGPFEIDGMESDHPGGSTVLRLRHGGKTVVYATDFEHGEDALRRLTAFAESADLLMYDGQYTPEEYERFRGFGHSTARMGLRLMRACGAKRLLIIHHDPHRTDAQLRAMEAELGSEHVRFAREGDVISI